MPRRGCGALEANRIRGNLMGTPMPTTKAQVSGHKFLRRRVEHGLVMGDVRMIHDPLAIRRRALTFGAIAVGLISLGSGLLAWLQPNPAPGDAPIVRSAQGQLFVRVEEAYHPVANLASARIIAGEAAEPASIGKEYLDGAQLGSPLGIGDAPGFLAIGSPHAVGAWSACFAGDAAVAEEEEFPTVIGDSGAVAAGETVVTEGLDVATLGEDQAALVESAGTQWMVTAGGRAALPEAETIEGRVMRRTLGITGDTHAWAVPEGVLNAYPELPRLEFPSDLPAVLDTNKGAQGLWASVGSGANERVWPLTESQATMLVDMGAELRRLDAATVSSIPTTEPRGNLPSLVPQWVGPNDGWLCATPPTEERRSGEVAGLAQPAGGTVALSGDGVADHFLGLSTGGVGVDTGNGYQVVSATGQRHAVAGVEVLEALGVGRAHRAPWEVIRLLPEGTDLNREEALKVTY